MKYLLAALILLSTGCTNLQVEVRVLDQTRLRGTPEWNEAEVAAREPAALRIAGVPGSTNMDARRAARDFFLKNEDAIKAYANALVQSGVKEKDAVQVVYFYSGKINAAYDHAAGLYRHGLDLATAARKETDKDKKNEGFIKALNAFNQADKTLYSMRDEIASDLSSGPVKLLEKVHGKKTESANLSDGKVGQPDVDVMANALLAAQEQTAGQDKNSSQPATTRATTTPDAGAAHFGGAAPQPAPNSVAPPPVHAAPQMPAAVASSPAVAAAAVSSAGQIQASVDDLIGNAGVFDDPHAGLVVNAPEDAWKGNFNTTKGFGLMGNSDIAIKMQSIGNFNLKGIRVDASKITQATFNGINLAVKVAAAAYGVPLPIGNNSNNNTNANTAAANPSPSTTDVDAEAQQHQARAAAVQILRSIASHADQLKDDTGYKGATTQVHNVYEAYKVQLGSGVSK